MLEALLAALLILLVLAVIYVVVLKVARAFGADEPIPTLVQCFFLVLALVILLRVFGVWGGGYYIPWHR